MKGYQITQFGIGNLRSVDLELPRPGRRDVLVRIRATSLNYRDLMMIEGTYNPKLKFPLVPFSDGAGEVVEIGSEVTRWKVGDRVCPIFMQGWVDGELDYAKFKTTLGGDLDGCLREFGAFHEDGLVRCYGVERFDGFGGVKKRRNCIAARNGRRFDLCIAICKTRRCPSDHYVKL
jgi:NADPH:quinone reductase-like Zn-dependent oxidoreductase